jgi:EAL domain-containing protein (putative c-di-GMP-specific phosphodiesterase class I)
MSSHAVQRPPIDHADYERFVAFAFAAADLVVELGAGDRITYAAGAFRADFGRDPDAFLGAPIASLVVPPDHDNVATALATLRRHGRLPPMPVRLANRSQKPVALAGLLLPATGDASRLCLTFALLPDPEPEPAPTSPASLLRAAEASLRASTGRLDLIEIVAEGGAKLPLDGPLAAALRSVAPHAIASDLASGRIGILECDPDRNLPGMAARLGPALRSRGVNATIVSHHLALAEHGLTPPQAARALRHALNLFAREGAASLVQSGYADGLPGYLAEAGLQATRLKRMIAEGSFQLVFQPIVQLAGRSVHHYEALIRPSRAAAPSLAAPQDFVMMAESVGLIEELDLKVAARVCEAACTSGKSIALNLSSQSVQSPAFRASLLDLFRTSRAAERRVSVEITETAHIDDLDEAQRTAEALHEIGVALALDDFGAGTAGVNMLRALRPATIKIDGSYTAGIVNSPRERALFAGMVDLARAGGATIVAEWVENERQAAALQSLGVQCGQGWLFGRPAALPLTRAVAARQPAREMWGR